MEKKIAYEINIEAKDNYSITGYGPLVITLPTVAPPGCSIKIKNKSGVPLKIIGNGREWNNR